jgi:hypothetical protein
MDQRTYVETLAPQYFPRFLAAFISLKRSAHDDPEKLQWAITQSPTILEKAWRVMHSADWVQAYIETGRKLASAPGRFAAEWELYKREYREAVAKSMLYAIADTDSGRTVVKHDLLDWLLLGDDQPIPPNVGKPYETAMSYLDWQVKHPNAEPAPEQMYGDEFVPALHDPVALVETAVSYFSEQDWKAEDQEFFQQSNRVVGAWKYLQEVLGFNSKEVWRRWNAAPLVILSTQDGSEGKDMGPLSDLYHEAVRCFAFGLMGAAMAMCRALLEEVLRRLYDIQGDQLGAVIVMAESRHAHLRKWRLGPLKNAANKILHDYGMGREVAEEKLVLQFLETLKGLIEEARTSKS